MATKDPPAATKFSQFIHPRNPYAKYDYESLATQFLEFKSYLTKVSRSSGPDKLFLDWTDRDAVRCLMKCCLHRDFGLDLDMPHGSLAPSLALKMNYLLWIEDTLKLNGFNQALGIDIGTGGAICFCGMAATKFGWQMIGTETNEADVAIAAENLRRNQKVLKDRVRVIFNKDKKVIFPPEIRATTMDMRPEMKPFVFTLSNPPFFEPEVARRERKKFSDAEAGREHEMVVEGGEIDFIGRMIRESLEMADRVDCFSTLVGQKRNLGQLQERLQQLCQADGSSGPKVRWIVNQFCQGKTMRWCLAWTFKSEIKLKATKPISEARHEKKLQAPIHVRVDRLGTKLYPDPPEIIVWLRQLIRDRLAMDITAESEGVADNDDRSENFIFEFSASKASWRGERGRRRQARREAEQEQQPPDREQPESKRPRLEQPADQDIRSAELPANLDPVLVGRLVVHRPGGDDEVVLLDVETVGGSLGKAGAAELAQYIRNRLVD